MREELLSTTRFVPLPVQQWQADASGGEAQQTTEVVPEENAGQGLGGVELTADDIFNATFTELSHDNPVVVEEKTPGETTEQVVEGDLPDPATIGKEPVVETPTGQQPQQQQQQPTDKPIEQVLRELLGERKEAAPAPVVETKPEPYKTPDYTPEQKAIVDAYEAEFPEMARAEQIIRAREYHAVSGYIFSQVQPVIAGQAERIKQLESLVGQMAGAQQVEHVEKTAGVSLAEIKPKIEAWIETVPEFIRPAYKAVAERGTTTEVLGLVKEWQKATGGVQQPQGQQQQQQPKPTEAKVIAQPVATIAPKTPVKVPAGLKPVPSMRTTPNDTGIARDDFEGAFAAFAKAGT